MGIIKNTKDTIDSRDIIGRIKELKMAIEDFHDDHVAWSELETLQEVVDQCDSCPDFDYGEILIRYSYFTEYCEEMIRDSGEVNHELPWYVENHINWDGVAEELKADYMDIDFDGITYFMRA